MRSILIDPYERLVVEVETDGSLASMHELTGAEIVTMMRVAEREACWVDDEGYLRAGVPVFQFDGAPLANAGKGLILGLTPEGDNRATRMSLESIRAAVSFPDLETTGNMTPSTPIEGPFQRHEGDMVFDHGILGGDPIFRERRNG